jgi:Na+-transporting methylmalonyl-CoA/oxaloacetate decarboxylase gamma subunit
MNNFGLLITIYGVASVFALLSLVIITTELLKRGFTSRIKKNSVRRSSFKELSDQETAAITAAIMAFNPDNTRIKNEIKHSHEFKSTTWRNVSKIELMNRRLRR